MRAFFVGASTLALTVLLLAVMPAGAISATRSVPFVQESLVDPRAEARLAGLAVAAVVARSKDEEPDPAAEAVPPLAASPEPVMPPASVTEVRIHNGRGVQATRKAVASFFPTLGLASVAEPGTAAGGTRTLVSGAASGDSSPQAVA